MAQDCDLCELKSSKINEWIVGSPTGSEGYAILDWKGKGGDIIIGLYRAYRATTEANGHGGYSEYNGDQYYNTMMTDFDRIGNDTWGSGSWGLVYHYPDYIQGGIGHEGENVEKIKSNDPSAMKYKKGKRLDRKPSKLENLGHYYIELIESGSDW